jgi:hypothetical protein
MVRAYLLGHALELFLKCFLMKAGLTTTVLKRKPYRHDLVALLAAAKARDLDRLVRVTPLLENAVGELAVVYPETPRYFSLLYLFVPPRLPTLRPLFRFAKILDGSLDRHLSA